MLSLLTLFLAVAGALESLRPTHPSQLLVGTEIDTGVRLTRARVIAFNRPRLEELFPFLKGRADAEIHDWILARFAYVDTRQLALTGIRNTKIHHDPADRIPLYIAPGAGRSADVAVNGRIVNLKGTGNSVWNDVKTAGQVSLGQLGWAAEARLIDHATGLEVYYQTVAEYLRHFDLQQEFDRDWLLGLTHRETVDALFLINTGFHVMASDQNLQAYILGRDGHFGRTTVEPTNSDYGRPNESYKDYGFYQTTYSGARLDFGGATTRHESDVTYADLAKHFGPDLVEDFVRLELQKILARPIPRDRSYKQRLNFKRISYIQREASVDPRVIGVLVHPRPVSLMADAPLVAQFKARLFELSPAQLNARLVKFSDEVLIHLFDSALGELKMPLPEAAYLHGLSRPEPVRASAFRAARPVLRRFPKLRERVIAEFLAEVKRETKESPPDFVMEMIAAREDFPDFLAHLLEALHSPRRDIRAKVLDRLQQSLHMNIGHTRSVAHDWPACETNLDQPGDPS